jgi:prepilin-type N-terminal cleavage/methylation domain-containing protein
MKSEISNLESEISNLKSEISNLNSQISSRARGMTLIEVLATVVLMAIVLPVAMQGVSLAVSASQVARQRTEAAALAESKLAELAATGDWQYGLLSGDFGPDWPDYRWSGAAEPWQSTTTMRQLSVRVIWTARGQDRQVILTTLVYGGQEAAL